MARTIALFNQSGGVGKTTLSMNLAYHLGKMQRRVLAIDMDPQASLTAFMGLKPFELSKTIRDSLVDEAPLPIHRDVFGIDFVPTNILLSQSEAYLFSTYKREERLKGILHPVNQDYDFIIIDCPPSLGLLSVMCLVAATDLLIPVQTEYKAVEGTLFLLNTIAELIKNVNSSLDVLGAIPTMYDGRTLQNKTALRTIEKIFGQLKQHPNFRKSQVFPPVPRRTDFANASAEHLPLAEYSPNNDALGPLLYLTEGVVGTNGETEKQKHVARNV